MRVSDGWALTTVAEKGGDDRPRRGNGRGGDRLLQTLGQMHLPDSLARPGSSFRTGYDDAARSQGDATEEDRWVVSSIGRA
jgi:hypothetical protein